MDYPIFIVSNQKEDSISIQRFKLKYLGPTCQVLNQSLTFHALWCEFHLFNIDPFYTTETM